MMHGFGFGFGWGGFLLMILFWGVLIAAAVAVVRALFSGVSPKKPTDPSRDENALEILNRRYASGEVSRDEYETIRQDLKTS